MASSLFAQRWRKNEACYDALRAAVMAELTAETDNKRLEADRVKMDISIWTAASSTRTAADRPTTAVATAMTTAVSAGSSVVKTTGIDNQDSEDDCSQVLIPALRAPVVAAGYAKTAPAQSCSVPPCSSPSVGSGARGGILQPVCAEGRAEAQLTTAPRGGFQPSYASNEVTGLNSTAPRADSSAAGMSTAGNPWEHRHVDEGRRPTVTAAAAAATAAEKASTATVQTGMVIERLLPSDARATTTKRGARALDPKTTTYKFLEDLIPAGLRPIGRRPQSRLPSVSHINGAGGESSTNVPEKTTKKQRKKRKMVSVGLAAASGPFSELSLCVVHLGSVTSNTIKAFYRGISDGGGQVSTRYIRGTTTHIVADGSISLSWEKLKKYLVGRHKHDAFEADCNAVEVRATTISPDDLVPMVNSKWVMECLRRFAVVSTEGYHLTTLPWHGRAAKSAPALAAAAATVAATVDADEALACHHGSDRFARSANSTAGSSPETMLSATAAEVTLSAAESTRKLAARNDDSIGSSKARGQTSRINKSQGAGGCGAAASGGRGTQEPLGSVLVKGGFGARDPDVGKRRHTFHCQFTGSGDQVRSKQIAFNEEAARKLERLAELCAARGGNGSVFRERGFKKAAGVLRRLGMHITDIRQLEDMRKNEPERVRGLGDSVMRELASFYAEGRMNRLEGLEADPKVKCMELLQKISWVGEATAEKLWNSGLRSIEDVRVRGQHLLNEQARICLNRHEDIIQRMPRAEAAEIADLVAKAAQSVCPGIICQACGSYRRGKSDCGDVDVLIRPPEGHEDSPVFIELIDKLKTTGFMTDTLAEPDLHKPGKPQTFMGICKLPGKGRLHRRLDIKLYPTSMFAFAVLYFTGSGRFNISMRSFARLKGLKLSDRGLFRVNSVNGEEVHRFPSYKCLREEDVFSALGLEWREPGDRDGVQVEPLYRIGDGGVAELSGRVAPVPPRTENAQHRWPALLEQRTIQHEDIPMMTQVVHHSDDNRVVRREAEEMRQYASFFADQESEVELRRAVQLGRKMSSGEGAGLTAASSEIMEERTHKTAYSEKMPCQEDDQMLQEAIRRSLKDTAASGRRAGMRDGIRLGDDEQGGARAGGDSGGARLRSR